MADRTGVFICTGYGIAESLDVEALCAVATEERGVPFCATVASCEGAGLEEINARIAAENLTRVVIAGISGRRLAPGAFPDGVLVEPVALRELVVWPLPAGEEDTQMAAADYLRMGIARVSKAALPQPFEPEEPVERSVLVVGGGITGLTAAREAAAAGHDVHLVEREPELGGWLGRQHRSFPTRPPFRELEDPGVEALVTEIKDDPRITIHTGATTASIAGAPGRFDVTLKAAGGAPDGVGAAFRVGAIVQATGWRPNDPRETLPYGTLEDVVLNVDLEEMVRTAGRITRPSDGRDVRSIAFIQCGGAQNGARPSFCSAVCCLTSLKQALYLREQDASAKAYIFYEFLRTPGLLEEFYRRTQEDPGIFLTRGQVEGVARGEGGGLVVTVTGTMVGARMQVEVDLVVLAAGMTPNSADGPAIRALEDAKHRVHHGESESQRQEAAEKVLALREHEGTRILNLDYRQGPDLPVLENGFPDSHFICFPYESRRTGIYPAGAVREPMDGAGAREDGAGAALKAIQCVEMTARGEALHPRAGDRSYPTFFMQRCTQCKRCTEECPFGVLNEDAKGNPLLAPTRCRRCGICMGACPERIVSFPDYSVDMVAAMIKAVEVPPEEDEKPRILAFLCENDALPALERAAEHRLRLNPLVRVIPVRCLGSVNPVWVSEALSAGFDGILLLGCKTGEDYQCHFITGSELAFSRGEQIREKLEQLALDNGRVELHEIQIADYEQLPVIFDKFMEVIELHGLNPFKGL